MNEFLYFLEEHYQGVLLLIVVLFALILAINWLAIIFSWGRFKALERSRASNRDLRSDDKFDRGLAHIFSRFLVNLIDDFKHLLALVIVIIFASLIIYSMTTTNVFKEKMEALQLVIASLGGLLGSIIGYYFGESAARNQGIITTSSEADLSNGDITPTPPIDTVTNGGED